MTISNIFCNNLCLTDRRQRWASIQAVYVWITKSDNEKTALVCRFAKVNRFRIKHPDDHAWSRYCNCTLVAHASVETHAVHHKHSDARFRRENMPVHHFQTRITRRPYLGQSVIDRSSKEHLLCVQTLYRVQVCVGAPFIHLSTHDPRRLKFELFWKETPLIINCNYVNQH